MMCMANKMNYLGYILIHIGQKLILYQSTICSQRKLSYQVTSQVTLLSADLNNQVINVNI